MKACGGVEVQFLSLLTLALDGGVWKTAHTTDFLPGKEHLLYSWSRRLAGPQSQSGRFGEETNLLFLSGIEPHFCAQGVNERGNGKSVSSFCLVSNISRLRMVSVSTLKCIKHISFVSYTSNIMSA